MWFFEYFAEPGTVALFARLIAGDSIQQRADPIVFGNIFFNTFNMFQQIINTLLNLKW